VREREMVER
jgi:hypothetical protein